MPKKTQLYLRILFSEHGKTKEILKEVREKKCHTYRGTKTRITSGFLEAMLGSKEWDKISKALGEKKSPRILQNYSSKVKEKDSLRQIKTEGIFLPVDLPCKKCLKKFFREKENRSKTQANIKKGKTSKKE